MGWLLVVLLLPLTVAAQTEVRLPVIADTNISAHVSERTFPYGARSTARVKGIEMFYLAQFDLAALRGQRVEQARFVCRAVRQQFRTLGFSTISAAWAEDQGTGDASRPGTTFLTRLMADGSALAWARPGGDFTDVAFTAGGSQVSYGTVEPLGDGWLQAPIAPALVEAMASGASSGLCVSDETGQIRANNDLSTREQRGAAPYLVVTVEPAPPPRAELQQLSVVAAPDESTATRGAARISYELAAPVAELARLRLELTVNGQAVEPWRLPALRAGRGEVLLDDRQPGEALLVRAVCGGSERTASGTASPALAIPRLPAVAAADRPAPDDTLFAVPGYGSVHPLTGNVLEEDPAAYAGPAGGHYRRLNPVWSRAGLTLAGARGETVAVQLVMAEAMDPGPAVEWGRWRGEAGELRPDCQVARVWYVPDPQPVGEVAVPLPANGWRPWPGTRYWTLLVEVSVPDEAPAGDYQTVCRWAGREFPVRLTVWNHALPDQLGYEVSLNSYGMVHGKFGIGEAGSDAALAVERAYHRLAHEHRLTWTPLTYGHSGRVEWGAAPRLSGEGEALSGDFEDFDRRFAPLLDGSAFADLPRAGVPLDHLYLPFHEQWPGPMSDYAFRPSTTAWPAALIEHALLAPPIEQAFPATYATRFEAAVGLFARHIAARGWRQTQFQGYLNNKYDYRDPARGGRGTSWWLLDEPMHRDDWLALAWFARLFQRGASGTPNLVFRADISRPQWQRQWLDGLVDLAVLGGAWYDHPERTGRWLAREGAVGWHYATANPVGAPNTDAVAWCLRAWLLGADGIVPWNSVGDEAHFERPEATALLLPGRRFGISGPVGSLRVKAFRAGQQEVERLRLLAAQGGYRRAQLKAALAPLLSLEAEFRRAFAEDAGVQSFNLTPDAIERLRRAVAAALEETA